MTTKQPPRGIPLLIGSLLFLLVAGGAVFHREIATRYHAWRLDAEPRYAVELAGAEEGSPRAEVLRAYLESAEGARELRRVFLLELLDRLDRAGAEPGAAPFDLGHWDRIELEVRRLHYDGPAAEWWIVYSAEDRYGRRTTGSARAPDSLVALERRLARLEPVPGRSIALAPFPGMAFSFEPSDVEEGEWRVVARRRR